MRGASGCPVLANQLSARAICQPVDEPPHSRRGIDGGEHRIGIDEGWIAFVDDPQIAPVRVLAERRAVGQRVGPCHSSDPKCRPHAAARHNDLAGVRLDGRSPPQVTLTLVRAGGISARDEPMRRRRDPAHGVFDRRRAANGGGIVRRTDEDEIVEHQLSIDPAALAQEIGLPGRRMTDRDTGVSSAQPLQGNATADRADLHVDSGLAAKCRKQD